MNVYDWLGNMELPGTQPKFDILEVRFKGGRKDFYRNATGLELYTGDPIVVETTGGWHVGFVSLQGELVRLQMKRKGVKESSPDIKRVFRLASEKDVEKLSESANKELSVLFRSRQLIDTHKLKMKLSDVEYQADATRVTFYYSSDDRVDFRDIVKTLATEFKVRVEMRQISMRQEAGRLGGIGVCGRELCCSTWLTDFKSVSASAARYQNLSLNPVKLSGQCGRLKCCLNYELDTYMDALRSIPKPDKPLLTEKGEAYLQKTDIFRRLLWFGYKGENDWHPISAERVTAIMALNKVGKKAPALTEAEEEAISAAANTAHIPLNDDLLRMDKKFSERDKAEKNKRRQKQKERESGTKTASGSFAAAGSGLSSEARPTRPERPDRSERSDRPERGSYPPRNERGEGNSRNNRPDRGPRPAGAELSATPRAPRSERPPQGERGPKPPRTNLEGKPENKPETTAAPRPEGRPERTGNPRPDNRNRPPREAGPDARQNPRPENRTPREPQGTAGAGPQNAPGPQPEGGAERSGNRNRNRNRGNRERREPGTKPAE